MNLSTKSGSGRLDRKALEPFKMNTVFVFRLKGEVTEGLAAVAGSNEKRRRAVRNGDIGTLELEHAFCVLVKE